MLTRRYGFDTRPDSMKRELTRNTFSASASNVLASTMQTNTTSRPQSMVFRKSSNVGTNNHIYQQQYEKQLIQQQPLESPISPYSSSQQGPRKVTPITAMATTANPLNRLSAKKSTPLTTPRSVEISTKESIVGDGFMEEIPSVFPESSNLFMFNTSNNSIKDVEIFYEPETDPISPAPVEPPISNNISSVSAAAESLVPYSASGAPTLPAYTAPLLSAKADEAARRNREHFKKLKEVFKIDLLLFILIDG